MQQFSFGQSANLKPLLNIILLGMQEYQAPKT
jgi:hypothetical protein